jgi:hypothetical protein
MDHSNFLQPASLETTPEDLLELWDVVKVHQRVVLPGNVSI